MKIKFLLLILFYLTDILPQVSPDTLTAVRTISDSLKQATTADTVGLFGDSLKISRKDTLAPIVQSPFYSSSFFIPNKKIVMLDYRYTADFLELFPFTFILDKGFIGQPNEVVIYGTGFNSISYFQDGVFFNGRYSNSADLNHIQSESVDSIEVLPAPRGFLYGPINNLVSVNLITKDFIPKVPYSRIKYYEGPFGEAMFDGIFSAMLFNKVILFADITNRKTDESFENSSFSIWQASARLKYLISNKLNISGSYNFVHSETGLNGGVDADSIRRITANIDSLLYSETLAPVVYPNAHQKNKQHHFNLRTLWNPAKNLKTDLNLYYKFYLDEIDNLKNIAENIKLLNVNAKSKILGTSVKQSYNLGILSSQFNLNYEYQDLLNEEVLDSISDRLKYIRKIFSVSPIISIALFDGSLIPSAYYKFSYRSLFPSDYFNGGGIDIIYRLNTHFNFYLGYSHSAFTDDPFNNINNRILCEEFGAKLNYMNWFTEIKIFNINGSHMPDYWGIGVNSEFNIWKLSLEFQTQYNKPRNKDNVFFNFTEFHFRGGIFFKDVLFDSSLCLKTGFSFYHFGKQKLFDFDEEFMIVDPSSRIDFTLAGEIQNTAIVYFTWENLLNENYYIVPYYPMPERSIRFGIAWEILN